MLQIQLKSTRAFSRKIRLYDTKNHRRNDGSDILCRIPYHFSRLFSIRLTIRTIHRMFSGIAMHKRTVYTVSSIILTPSKFYVIIQPNIVGFPPPDVYFDIVLIASTTSTIKLRIAVISSIMSVALCILSPLFFFFRLLNALTSFLYILYTFRCILSKGSAHFL